MSLQISALSLAINFHMLPGFHNYYVLCDTVFLINSHPNSNTDLYLCLVVCNVHRHNKTVLKCTFLDSKLSPEWRW